MPPSRPTNSEDEPRWPAVLASVAIGALELALPRELVFGPRWLLLLLVGALTLPAVLARRRGRHRLNQIIGFTLNGIFTLALLSSLAVLVYSLLTHPLPPKRILATAAVLWTSNVLVFASWYWRLDAGGPHARDLRDAHTEGAFLFPQMSLDPEKTPQSFRGWTPRFIDYLFLAFNASTSFSPSDVPVLSRWAKALMMVQSSISLVTLALLAARAVNIL